MFVCSVYNFIYIFSYLSFWIMCLLFDLDGSVDHPYFQLIEYYVLRAKCSLSCGLLRFCTFHVSIEGPSYQANRYQNTSNDVELVHDRMEMDEGAEQDEILLSEKLPGLPHSTIQGK